MSELFLAAKAAIDILDPDDLGILAMEVIADLRIAVERAEIEVKKTDAYEHGYIAGQKAMLRHERERIRARVRLAAISSWSASEVYIGPQFIQLQKFVDRLLEDGEGDEDEAKANALLIAAAPEMLEFAKWVASLKTGGLIEGRAREVIAKAGG